ncbi:MAG TPA: glutathione S-transferase [Erythrobacter sp.]|nr:glutathione S-transferase [Erythrobacter sp.]
MAELRTFHLPGAWGLVTLSPFCLKLDAFLRMTGIEHEAITASTPFGGPKKKAPWIEYKGKKMGDSTLIIDFLKQEFGKDPDAHLDARQRATIVTMQRLIEENLYWVMVYDRWARNENWPRMKSTVLRDIPAPVRSLLAPYARYAVKKQLAGHGMGLHSTHEIESIARKDIDALAALLGEGPWNFGEQPTMADATVYSLLANILFVEFESTMKDMIRIHPTLTAMLERFRARFYAE